MWPNKEQSRCVFPMIKYPANQHAKAVASLLSGGVIYLRGDVLKERHDTDVELPFRQESNFYYLTGVNEPGFHYLYNLATRVSVLIAPNVDPSHIIWMGQPDTLEEMKAKYDVDQVEYKDKLFDLLTAMNPSVVHVLPGTSISELGEVAVSDDTQLKNALIETRLIKSDAELAIMRRANDISSNAHIELMKHAKLGVYEYELEARFIQECWRHGNKTQAYNPIVAAGKNAATLHYGRNMDQSSTVDRNQLVLVDAGCEHECYASDITRTWPVGGKFIGEARTLYEIVLRMQKAVLGELKAGVEWEDMHRLATRICCEGLMEAGVIKNSFSIAELMDKHIPAIFFPHGLGHLIGLDVHDVGGYPQGVQRIQEPGLCYLRMRRTLKANMVVTVEPGCYFTDALVEPAIADPQVSKYLDLDVLAKYRPLGGVRIEDCVVIKESGYDNLTTAPKEIGEIEAIMAQ
jgi:Xaa-Pro dipeptidase